jgi:hypothetical protein
VLAENYLIGKMELRNKVVMMGGGLCKLAGLLIANDSFDTIRKYC